jgi:hypothetical protein
MTNILNACLVARRENDFEDGAQNLYRFLEHDPAVPKYHNFRGSTNDGEPRPAAAVGQRMTKIMVAILEAYASDDRRRIDYARVAASEEFRRYANLARDLQRVDVFALPAGERLPFFLNLHNAMAIHAVIRNGGQPSVAGVVDRRSFFADFQYVVGGYPYSLTTIKNGILRANRRQPYTIVRPFGNADKRLEVRISSAACHTYSSECSSSRKGLTFAYLGRAAGGEAGEPAGALRAVQRHAVQPHRALLLHAGRRAGAPARRQGVPPRRRRRDRHRDPDRTPHQDHQMVRYRCPAATLFIFLKQMASLLMFLTGNCFVLCRYSADFGQDRDILRWILNYLDPTKAGLLTHILNDGGPISIAYQDYDWSLNA